MDSILQLCDELGDVGMEECQLVLDNPQDPVSETLSMNLPKSVMENLLSKIKNIGDDIPRNALMLNGLKKLSAYAIFNVLNGADLEGESLMYQNPSF